MDENIFYFTENINFPKSKYKNVEYFILVHADKLKNWSFLAIARYQFFIVFFIFLFLGPFTLATFCISCFFFWC